MKAPYLFAIIALVITFAALSLPNLEGKSASPVAMKDETPATSLHAADDIRSTATNNASYLDNELDLLRPPDGVQNAAAEKGIIDPDKSFFGVPLGTSEDRLIRKFGEPVGYLRLTDNRSLILYGDTVAFIFQSGKLSGILLRDKDWGFLAALKQELPSKNPLWWPEPPKPWDNQWELNNGLKNKMSLVDVRGILGDSLQPEEPTCKNSRYRQYYLTDKSKVSLGFVRTGKDNEDDENAYWLYSVRVEPRQKDDY